MQSAESQYKTTTLLDLQLAAIYYPMLIELAKHKHLITYKELVDEAKRLHPENKVVQISAIPTTIGRRLDVIRVFTKQRELPDLAALIISKRTGGTGGGYKGDAKLEQQRAFAFDWSSVSTTFDLYVGQVKTAITPRKRIDLKTAANEMWEYYRLNKSSLPLNIDDYRELILEMIRDGIDVEQAFRQALLSQDIPADTDDNDIST
jgi:hypothetical protein